MSAAEWHRRWRPQAPRDARAAAAERGWPAVPALRARLIFGRRRNLPGSASSPSCRSSWPSRSSCPSRSRAADRTSSAPSPGTGCSWRSPRWAWNWACSCRSRSATIAGDSVAGEANIGTLRYLLAVPVDRTRLLAVKYAAIVIFSVAARSLVAVVGSIMGLALFGAGDMTLLSGQPGRLRRRALRVLLAALYLARASPALGAIGLFISTLTEQPIGATIAVVIVNVLMFILDAIPQLDWLHPWLLTHWWAVVRRPAARPDRLGHLGRGLLTAAAYAVVFWLAAWARFSGKDITS